MKIERKEIKQGIFLNYLHMEKFKTSCISLSLLTQLDKESAPVNALIPFVLTRGSSNYPDIEKISNRLDELYGASIEPSVKLSGEIQCIGLYTTFVESSYLPAGNNILADTVSLIGELLLNPIMENGLFLEEYVESEKEKLADVIRSTVNEKRSYSVKRCIQEMCAYEDFSVGKYGSAEDCENVEREQLTDAYRNLLKSSPIEIFYCGSESLDTVFSLFAKAFSSLKRGHINYDIGTDIRMNSVEESPRYFEENLDVTQGKLVLGFRLGEIMEDLDKSALMVFNTIYGSGVTSKLFNNVREKLSLCYFASSMVDAMKGIMLVSSGIEFENYDKAKDEILHQLDEIKNGNISDEELLFAKRGIISDLAAVKDNPCELELFYFNRILSGDDSSPEERSLQVETVTREDVMKVANSVVLDLIYFLRN